MSGRQPRIGTKTLVASLVATLVLGSSGSISPANASAYAADGDVTPVSMPTMVPALDTMMDHGQVLLPGVPRDVRIGGIDNGVHSALVRLSVFEATAATVITAGDAPALNLPAHTSASTTILVPVKAGLVTLQSSAHAHTRLEVIATFAGSTTAAGSTIALPMAVNRPGEGQTVPASPGQPALFGVSGVGGVPSSVRAVHVSLTVDAASTSLLDVDGQVLPVAAGRSTLSTIVTPSVGGGIEISSTSPVDLRLDVRGWVVEAAPHSDRLNGPGAFWSDMASGITTESVSEDSPVAVELAGRQDASHVLVMLWAEPTTHLSTLDLGAVRRGRATGAVVDPTSGTQPQLVVVPAERAQMSLRRGATTAHVLVVGSLIGSQPQTSADAASITVDSPLQGTIELVDAVTFTFQGSLGLGDVTPLRIEVLRNGQQHGLGAIRTNDGELGWSFTTGVRESGTYMYTFVLVGRDGSRVTTGWTGDIIVPGADAVLLQEWAVVLGWPGVDAPILSTGEDHVIFGAQPGVVPGDVIIGGVEDGSPFGLLRRVVAIDVVGGTWRVTTVSATFEDVFLRVDVTAWQPLHQPGSADPELEIIPVAAGTPGDHQITEAALVSFDEAGLEPLENVSDPVAVDDDEIEALLSGLPHGGSGKGQAARFMPMRAPVPKKPEPLEPSGPSEPAPNKPIPVKGEARVAHTFKHTFEDEGSAAGVDYSLSLTGELAVALSVVLNLQVEIEWPEDGFPWPTPSVKLFETYIKSTAKASVEGSLSFEAEWKKSLPGAKVALKFEPITIWIGPVPIVISSKVDIAFKATVTISASFTADFSSSVQSDTRAGFRYKQGKAEVIDEAKYSHKGPEMGEDAVLSGEMSAAAGPEFAFSLLLYDLVGPSVGIGLKVGLGLKTGLGAEGPTVDAEIFLSGNLFVRVVVTIPVIDYKLVEATLMDEKFKWQLWSWKYDYSELFPNAPPTSTPTPDPTPTPEPTPMPTPTPTPTPDPDPDPELPAEVSALDFARAMTIQERRWIGEDGLSFRPVPITGAAWVEGPPHPAAAQIIEGNFPGSFTDTSYPVMSSGDSDLWEQGWYGGEFGVISGRGPDVFDVTTLRIDLDLSSTIGCIRADYWMGSDNIQGDRAGFFLMEWGATSWSVSNGDVAAPDGLIKMNIQYDDDRVFVDEAVSSYSIRDRNSGNQPFRFGAAAHLTTFAILPAGESSLYLSIGDSYDDGPDTAVVLGPVTFAHETDCSGTLGTFIN